MIVCCAKPAEAIARIPLSGIAQLHLQFSQLLAMVLPTLAEVLTANSTRHSKEQNFNCSSP